MRCKLLQGMIINQDEILALSRVKTRNLVDKHTELRRKFLIVLSMAEEQQKDLEFALKVIDKLSIRELLEQ